jgi:hypothetical protein
MAGRWHRGIIALGIAAGPLTGSAAPLHAQAALEVFFGTSYSLHTPLTIYQQGYPELSQTAHYETRPFIDTWYYSGRLAFWGKHDNAWVVDFTHQKIYLANPVPEIQDFKVTFGYNQLGFGRAWHRHGFNFSATGGVVIANPYSIIRGQELARGGGMFNTGYRFAGITAQGGLNKQFRLVERLFFSMDTRLSASWARVPVQGGHANAPNIAWHLHLGMGYGGPRHWGVN